MGNSSVKSSNKKLTAATKRRHSCCCCPDSSDSISSCSTDEKYYPTFDRLRVNNGHVLPTIERKPIFSCRSGEDLQKAWQGTISIDQWIDSLPILGTTPAHQRRSKQSDGAFVQNDAYAEQQLERTLASKINRDVLNLTKKGQLNMYVKDYLHRLQSSNMKQTFKSHFSSSKLIYPCNGVDQTVTDDLILVFTTPPESILPHLSISTAGSHRIHEQICARCYFIPFSTCPIEPDDDEYKQRCMPLDRTHVVITLVNKQTIKADSTTTSEWNPPLTFVSDDSFQTGLIRLDPSRMTKEMSPFVHQCLEENTPYLSSHLLQQWLNTLLLVNQTCTVAKRFLLGDGSHITCLLQEPSNTENVLPYGRNLTLASFRLAETFSSNYQDDKLDKMPDGFSSVNSSLNRKLLAGTIQVDYEYYSVGFLLSRWPKVLLDSYVTHPLRASKRRWPSKLQMDVLTKKPLLLIPDARAHSWKINFDLIEDHLFESMGESALYVYTLCQQALASTYTTRQLIKHGFLNYCEKYGVPFSDPRHHLSDLITDFLRELSEQIHRRCLPNYFNQQINLLDSAENYTSWFDHISRCAADRTHLTAAPLVASPSNRLMIVEFFFHFTERLHRTFRHNRSEFHLNDTILLDLHRQVCEDLLTNDQYTFFCNQQTMEYIRMNLTQEFETNAELIHTCLNQIRKAQSSLLFHYIWTIYVQYLHTYYNVLWNMESRDLVR